MNIQHGRKHSIRWLALEMNVDRLTLTRRLTATGKDTNEKFTVAEAVEAWTLKAQREADRDRKIRAEAENVELDAMRKRGDIHRALGNMIEDYALKAGAVVIGSDHLNADQRKRLLKELRDIERPKPQI